MDVCCDHIICTFCLCWLRYGPGLLLVSSLFYRAKEILGEVIERLKGDKCEAFQLQFSGVGHFGNNVVFAKVKDGPAKDKLYHIAGNFLYRCWFSWGPPLHTIICIFVVKIFSCRQNILCRLIIFTPCIELVSCSSLQQNSFDVKICKKLLYFI